MKKIIPLILIVLVVAGIVIYAVPYFRIPIFGIQLAYNYNPGERSVYKSDTVLDVEMDLENAPPELVENFKNKDTRMTIKQEIVREVKEVEGGVATLAITSSPKTLDMEIGGKAVSMPPPDDENLEQTVILKIAPSGEIIEATSGKSDFGENLKQNMKLFQHQIRFPEKMIKPGYTWTEDVDAPIQVGIMKMNMKGTIEYKFEKIEKYKQTNCALITYKGDFESKVAVSSTAPVSMSGGGIINGKIYFDYEDGELAAVNSRIKVDMEMNLKSAVQQLAEMVGFKLIGKADIRNNTYREENLSAKSKE